MPSFKLICFALLALVVVAHCCAPNNQKAMDLADAKTAKTLADTNLKNAQQKVKDGNEAKTKKAALEKIKDVLEEYQQAKTAFDNDQTVPKTAALEMAKNAAETKVNGLEVPNNDLNKVTENLATVNQEITVADAAIAAGTAAEATLQGLKKEAAEAAKKVTELEKQQ
ncbi:hypothetical protein L596_008712 [Steinernema carpocapsae]|uniref:SXP/RAL-2 family protein Ani s 5-like cation-binding domain-containing protein n=1 Tax=Steinernema carpocapsae TaxID=34508 RepID=A0A4U5PDU2_STECR|nr:hypothetical protein L596_008712 [Steinernema carpocapsae]